MQGLIVNGCIRDSEDISKMKLGVKALATYPLKSSKRDPGLRDVPVLIAGTLTPPVLVAGK
jgi:regulator of ribonuclease activity A